MATIIWGVVLVLFSFLAHCLVKGGTHSLAIVPSLIPLPQGTHSLAIVPSLVPLPQDALLWSMNNNAPFSAAYGPTTIALTNGGGIRTALEAGNLTVGQVLTVLPFGNVLQVRQLTGQQLINTLTFSADGYTSGGFGGFLQVPMSPKRGL